ncbi:MAG TPA: NAD(P)-dependent alcohol dehydrogenase [Naasia sp.]
MKAWIYTSYGGADRLRLTDVPVPAPAADEVLVRVVSVSLNGSDAEALRGSPAYARLGGLRRPRRQTLGSDIAGTVEAAGAGVTRFAPGDRVFGDILDRLGGLAEFARARESTLAVIPEGMSFDEAAALPQGGVIALQGIRDAGGVRPGQRVLVNGAGGSAGSFAVQFAHVAGAEVTAVDSAAKHDLLRELGADSVLDYATEDFSRGDRKYDLVFDVFARRSAPGYLRALAPGGSLLFVGGPVRRMLGLLLAGLATRPLLRRRLRLLVVRPRLADLLEVARALGEGRIRVPVGHLLDFDDVPYGFRLLLTGKARGKVVVRVAPDARAPIEEAGGIGWL